MDDLSQKMLTGFATLRVRDLVAQLRAAGVPDAAIARVLANEADALWRPSTENEDDGRKIVAPTGKTRPAGLPLFPW